MRTGAVPHLPAAGPVPGAAWEVRGQAKHGPEAPGFCRTVGGPEAAVSEHPWACAIKAGTRACPVRGA